MSRKVIQLTGGPPWGFRMCGGKDTTLALKIARVNPESKAARYGIREGDLVTGINGDSVDHLTNAEVQKVLKKSGASISLELRSAKRVNVGESAGNLSGETSSSITEISTPVPYTSTNSTTEPLVTSNSIHDIHITNTSTSPSTTIVATTTPTNLSPVVTVNSTLIQTSEKTSKCEKEKKSKKKVEKEGKTVKDKVVVVTEPEFERQVNLQSKEQEERHYNKEVSTSTLPAEGDRICECECILHKEGKYEEGHIINNKFQNKNLVSINDNNKENSEMNGKYLRGKKTVVNGERLSTNNHMAGGVGVGIVEGDLLGEIIAELDGFLDTSFFDEKINNPQGVWSPGIRNDLEPCSPVLNPNPSSNGNNSTNSEEPILPVWTPTTAPSPSTEKKFRPVNFNVPSSSKHSDTPRSTLLEKAPSPPKREIVRSSSWNQSQSVGVNSPQSAIPSSAPSLHQAPEQQPFSASQLPKYQNPTITLLQKAREGQLPRGAHYLDHKTPTVVRSSSASGFTSHTRPGSYPTREPTTFNPNPNETLYEVRIEEGPPSGKRLEFTPRKFDGIGPTTPDGVPLALRSGIKDEQQHEFYRRWYNSLHVDKPHRSGRSPYGGQNTSGSWSEPEGYESDSYAYKYAALDRRKQLDRNFEADYFSPEPFNPTSSTVPGIRFQPGRIEDYTPGTSLAPKAIHRHKPLPHWGLGSKDLGYESDSNLIIRKREDVQSTPPPPPLSPSEQRQVYVDIQKGGEVPLQGLRKPAPERSRASYFRRIIMPTFEEFKRGIPPHSRNAGVGSPRSIRSGSPALMKTNSPSTISLLQDRIQAKLSRSKSDLNPEAPKIISRRNKILKRPISAQSLVTTPTKLIHTSRTVTQIRKNGASSGIPVRTVSRDTSFEKLGIRSPELTSPREVKKALETSHKLTVRLEVETPTLNPNKLNGNVTTGVRKSGLKKTPSLNGKILTSGKAKSVKITIEGNGIPTKPPRKVREVESLSQNQTTIGKGKIIPKVTKVTQVASRHAGCLSPHHSRPTSPGSSLSISTSLSNLHRGSSCTNLQNSSSGSSHTLRDRNTPGKSSLTACEMNGSRNKLDSSKKKALSSSLSGATSASTINGASIKSSSSSGRKLIRELGDGDSEKGKKYNRLTFPDAGRKSRSDTDSGIGLGEKVPSKPKQNKLKKLESRNDDSSVSPLCLIASQVAKPEVRLAKQKKTNLCSSGLNSSPATIASSYFTMPGRRKGFHSRDCGYCCYEVLTSLEDSTFRSLPALTPYLKETKRVSNSSFIVRNGNRSISPIPRPTLTSFMRERLGVENRVGVQRSSSLQSLRGKKEYTSYVLELQHSRRKSARFVQLHRLYSSLERLGQLEKSTSMYDIPILSLEKQLDFDAWWKVRKRNRVDAEIESISSELSNAQKNREFFYCPRKTEEFRWKGDSALRIKKWSIHELRHFLRAGDWLKKPEELLGYKSVHDLHKTAWRGTSVKEVALNMEVASLSKTRNEYYQEGSMGRFGWLRRAFSMSSTLSDEQRTNIKQRLGTLIEKNTSTEVQGSSDNKNKKLTQGRPITTSRMGSTASSVLYRTESGRIIGVDGCMTESAKQQLSRTLSQEIRDRKALNSVNTKSLRNSSEVDGESYSDHSGKTVINVPVTTQVLLNKNKYKDSCTKNKIPAYSMYCSNGVPSKVNFFETYYGGDNKEPEVKVKENILRLSRPPVSFSTVEKSKINSLSQKSTKSDVIIPGVEKHTHIKYNHRQSPVLTRRSRSASPTWRTTTPGCSDEKQSYMSHVNVISKLAALILKRDENLKHLIRREIMEHEKLERLRLSNDGEVDRLKYHYETYYPKDISKMQPEVNLLRCLFCSDSNLARLTNCHSTHRRCASADIFKDKLMDLCDRAPDGREASPTMSMSPDLYFNSRSRKPIYQPSSTPNICQPTLTAHCYLESPTKSITDYGSDFSGGIWDYISESPNTTSLSPTPSSNPTIPVPPRDLRSKNWNYDPSIHQPKYRYVPPQPLLHPPPIPPPPKSDKNMMLNNSNSLPHLYRTVRNWNPGSRRELGVHYHGRAQPTRYITTPGPNGGNNRNNNYNNKNDSNINNNDFESSNFNLRRAQDEIEGQMRMIQAEIETHNQSSFSPNNKQSPVPATLASPLLSPVKYSESEVNIHFKAPIRIEEKDYIGEEELRQRQQAAMKRFYEEQRHRKFIQEIQDIESRRHMDNFIPSQKSPIPLNRYEDVIEESQCPKWREKTPEHKLVAKALHNFVAQNARELNFRKGDILFLRRKLDANWYEGEHNAAVGIFPTSYVEIIPTHNGERATPKTPSEGQAKVRFNFTAASSAEMSIAKGETIVLTRRVDPNWYEGRIGSRSGIFPVSYVQVLKEPGSSLSSSLSPKPIGAPAARTLIPQNEGGLYQSSQHGYRPNQYSINSDLGNIQNFNRPQRPSSNGHHSGLSQDLTIDTRNDPISYRAIYNYPPAHEDELELRENDVVHVLEKCDDGWYVGVSVRSGLFGTFPGNYVERIY